MATDKTAEQLRAWSYCPECGCDEAEFHRDGLRVCDNCGQDYYSTVDYTIAVKKNLSRMFASKNTRADSGEAVAWMVHEGSQSWAKGINKFLTIDDFAGNRENLAIAAKKFGAVPVFTHPRATAVDVRDAERWRRFVEMIDPDLCPGGFTIYYATEKGMDQLCYHGDVTEHVEAAIAHREGEGK